MDPMFEVPGSNISSALINENTVNKGTPPIYKYDKRIENNDVVDQEELQGGV